MHDGTCILFAPLVLSARKLCASRREAIVAKAASGLPLAWMNIQFTVSTARSLAHTVFAQSTSTHAHSTLTASRLRHAVRRDAMPGHAPALRLVSACLWASCFRLQHVYTDMAMSRSAVRTFFGGARRKATRSGAPGHARSLRATSRPAFANEAAPCTASAPEAAQHVLDCISGLSREAHPWCASCPDRGKR